SGAKLPGVGVLPLRKLERMQQHSFRRCGLSCHLSLPKIISANNDCVVRRGLGWRGGFHIVVSVVAAVHPYPIQDACASHCNTPNTRSGTAADAVRQRSERDPNSRAVAAALSDP